MPPVTPLEIMSQCAAVNKDPKDRLCTLSLGDTWWVTMTLFQFHIFKLQAWNSTKFTNMAPLDVLQVGPHIPPHHNNVNADPSRLLSAMYGTMFKGSCSIKPTQTHIQRLTTS